MMLRYPSVESIINLMFLQTLKMKRYRTLTHDQIQGLLLTHQSRGNHIRFKGNSHPQARWNFLQMFLTILHNKIILQDAPKSRGNYLPIPQSHLTLKIFPPQQLLITNKLIFTSGRSITHRVKFRNPSAGIQTRSSSDLMDHCHYVAFMSSVDPRTIN